jgi:hypothetical protein
MRGRVTAPQSDRYNRCAAVGGSIVEVPQKTTWWRTVQVYYWGALQPWLRGTERYTLGRCSSDSAVGVLHDGVQYRSINRGRCCHGSAVSSAVGAISSGAVSSGSAVGVLHGGRRDA